MSQNKDQSFSQKIRALFSSKQEAEPGQEIAVPAVDVKHFKSLGNALLAQGKISEANACYRQVVALTPNDGLAHINLGYGLLELGDLPAAKECLERATELDAKLLDGHFLLGKVLLQQGLHEEAIQRFKTAVSLKPDFHFAWFELARAQETLHQFDAALEDYERVLALNSSFFGALLGKVRMLLALEHWQEALATTDQYAEQHAEQGMKPELALLRAQALLELEQLDEALSLVDQVLLLDPEDIRALHGKATVLMALKHYEPALELYEQVLAREPGFVEALSNAGAACEKLGRFNEALDFLERALAMESTDAQSLYNMSSILMRLHRCDEAIALARRGLVHQPLDANLHWNMAISHLLLGDLRPGWEHYEWRWHATALGKRPPVPAFTEPQWRGESLADKTILIYAEQGLGDTIQLLRYIPLLAERGARVLLRVPSAIEPLCGELKKYCVLIDDVHPAMVFDYHCPFFSVPLAFDTILETIPAQLPYLKSEVERRALWEEKLGPRHAPRIGLVWSGNASQANDKNRSMPLTLLMAGLPGGFQWVSLQKEVRPSDLPALEANSLFHAGEDLRTFADTAALIDCMDLVISVDTSVAHLAGALGKPLWVLVSHLPDWRWMLEREDSPWYPGARLIRQTKHDGWEGVIERVASELQNWRLPAAGN